jgi:hypothetical protein
MKFTPKELEMIINKKVDRVIFYCKKDPVLDLPLERLVYNMIESTPELKKELIERALGSED